MSEFKSGFVAMLGRTNVGKSTLVNLLVGEKIAATANKVQTTRTAIRGIVNRENSQIIFIDTPGIHKPKTKLNETMIETSFGVIKDIDLILFVIEATSDEIGRGDMRILEKIKESKKKAILIINKIDLVKKENGEMRRGTIIEVKDLFYNKYKDLKNIDEIIKLGDKKEDKQKYYVDTVKINIELLKNIGLKEKNIIDSNICTMCHSKEFHSYRADGKSFGVNGAIIAIK